MNTIKDLFAVHHQPGTLHWIGVRPARRAAVRAVPEATLSPAEGLAGDHYAGRSGKRQVTLLQAEYLPVLAALTGHDAVDPAWLRRNLLVAGINLLALRDTAVQLGEATLEITGQCHPCSRMAEALGPGGYNAVRGHGGLTARVLTGGTIRVGDLLVPLEA